MAVTGVTRADSVNLDGSVNGKRGIEDRRDNAESEGCEAGGVRRAVSGYEGVRGIEKAKGRGGKAWSRGTGMG